MNKKIISIFVAVATLISIVTAAIAIDRHYNNRFATQQEFNLLSMRLEQKIVEDRLDRLRDKIRDIKIQYGDDPSRYPDYIRKAYYELLDEIKKQEVKLGGS